MKNYVIQYLPTGRIETDRDGNVIILTGNSERGAKQKFTREGNYRNWDMYALREVEL